MKRRSKPEVYGDRVKEALKATSKWPQDGPLLERLYLAIDEVLIGNVA